MLRMACLVCITALAPLLCAQGQLGELQAEYRALYKKVAPSVVCVATTPYDEIESTGGTAVLRAQASADTGFVIEGGYVLCNAESFMRLGEETPGAEGAARLTYPEMLHVIQADGTSYQCSVVGSDIRSLLLVLKLPTGVELPALKLADSTQAEIGQTVAAFGNSFDSLIVDHQASFAIGSLSDFYRFELDDPYGNPRDFGDPYRGNVFEVESTVNPGDYGGPLVNLDGEVIGMLTAHFAAGRQLGTAVPSSQFKIALDAIIANKPLAEPHLGFWVKNMKPGKQKDPTITRVDAGSSAEAAGLKGGDVIVLIDTLKVNNRLQVHDALAVEFETLGDGQDDEGSFFDALTLKSYGLPPGAIVAFTVRRGEQMLTFEVTVGELPADALEDRPDDESEGE